MAQHDPHEPQDRRVKRTQRLLAEALLALTLEKGYEAVTIRDITDRADVGYATFFRHYPDKDALLQEVAEVVMGELMALLPPAPEADPAVSGTLLFRYIRTHEAVCRVLLGSKGSPQLLSRIVAEGSQEVLSEHTARATSVIPPEIAAHHLVASTLTLVQWWLDHDMLYPEEQMGVIYRDLINLPAISQAFVE
jgi:AcrR family transcriptional regulator